jgi:predicted nucleic acid-binding protein
MMERNQGMVEIAVVDTCALFSAVLRDTLLWVAEAEFYDIRLTDEILEELRRNLVKKQKSDEKQARNLIVTIKQAFPEHFVQEYQRLIDLMPVNQKDRHVLAAAVVSRAQVIVTHNLKDFPSSLLVPHNVEARSPDAFLLQLFADNREEMKSLLMEQAANLRNPPLTVLEVLDKLAVEAPHFVRVVRELF